MIKACKQGPECGTGMVEAWTDAETSTIVKLKTCMECHGYLPIGPSTDYESLDRREKQLAYELWAAANAESKPERRVRRTPAPKLSMRRERQIERTLATTVAIEGAV